MKKYILYILVLLLASCGKDIDTGDVLSGLTVSNTTVNADGTSTVDITVTINAGAGADKRNVVITATGGELVNAANGKLIVPATLQNAQLVASATWKAPMSPGEIIIKAAPEATSVNADYFLTKKITAALVLPASVHLETSSFGIGRNFINTDTLTGTLKSSFNKKVSLGAKVKFDDLLESGGATAGGRFRLLQASSDASSQVRVLYSAANWQLGTNILMELSVLDELGNKTPIRDTVKLTINQQ